jgi:uncharacterized membrane protein
LYLSAGVNHFVHPLFYEVIIPFYIPAHKELVIITGVIEIILALLLLFRLTRKGASILIALMLIAFLPVHIFMLQQSYFHANYQISSAMAWLRLLLQPLLIIWVLWQGKMSSRKNL